MNMYVDYLDHKLSFYRAGWNYVVDNLPTEAGQLRGTLLVIMPEKLKNEWAEQTQQKIKRIVELSHRLKFLMRLSQADSAERKKFFTEDLPSLPVRKKSRHQVSSA